MRPGFPQCFRKACPAIRNNDLRFGDPRHECAPGTRMFIPAKIPAEDMLFIPADQYAGLAGKIDPIQIQYIPPITGGSVHISQNFDVFLRKVRPSPGRSLCVCLLNSHLRKTLSCFASLLILGEKARLHPLQNHLCVPAFVLPCFVQTLPQIGQITCFMIPSSKQTVSKEDITPFSVEISTYSEDFTNTFCPTYIFSEKRYNRCIH